MARTLTRTVVAEKRQRDTARLYLQGFALGRIAEVTHVHVKTVQGDLRAVRKRWREDASRSIQKHVDEALARIDLVEAEAWIGWEASKQPEVAQTTDLDFKPAQRPDQPDVSAGKRVSRREVNRGMDDAFLARIAWCIEQRCKLLGLYPSQRKDSGGEGGGPTLEITARIRMAMSDATPEELDTLGSFYARLGVTQEPGEAPLVLDEEAPEDGSS